MTRAEGRRFAFPVGLAFVVAGTILWRRGNQLIAAPCLALGTLLLGAGILVPGRLGWLHARWMTLAYLISRVTTPVMMSAVFILVVTPIGLVRRLVARNPLTHTEQAGSFWKARQAPVDRRSSMERQF